MVMSMASPVSQPPYGPRPRFGHGTMGGMSRISARVEAIAESATLAVDAKAKALKAAGRPVIAYRG